MKDLEEANNILGIKLIRVRKKRWFVLSQASYIDKTLERFSMHNPKKGAQYRLGTTLSYDDCPKTSEDVENMRKVQYASDMGSLMYVMLLRWSVDAN